jgi:hypothetical protein
MTTSTSPTDETTTALDYLIAHAPAPSAPVSPALLKARGQFDEAGRELVGIGDADLEKTWVWRGDADVRYGLFRAIEAVEEATGEIAAILEATGARRSNAALRVAPTTAARWDLHGRLVALDEGLLDRVAKEGEWTVRETLGHIVGGQRGYVAYTVWHWLRNSAEAPTEAEREQVEIDTALPEESAEGAGSIAEIRTRLDETVDRGGAHFAGMTDADLARPARWSGLPVNVGFRVGRWSSHLMEHTIQVDKTLAWLDRTATEAERVVGDLYRAWGRLETLIFPIEPAALSRLDPDGRTVESVLSALGEQLVSDARSTRAAAEA